MSTLTLLIVIAFVIGYACIATESVLEINKAAIALLMCVACWTLFMMSPESYIAGDDVLLQVSEKLKVSLGDTAETLFFLMGAMTIVEIVDANGGFNFVRDTLKTRSKRKLMWRIAFMTFVLSAILDNLTTSIVMIMVLRKLVQERKERILYAALVIIAANSGGAFSPIGDVTTIMLWIKGVITTQGVITEILVPSLISMVIPAFIMQFQLSGKFDKSQNLPKADVSAFTKAQRDIIFWLGVGGLCFVPVFRGLTNLPPFMGILLVLGILWTVTEIFHRSVHREGEEDTMAKRVTDLLSRIDLSTMVDNVPLVAGAMGMYPVAPTGDMAVDGIFWQLLAYCAGVGGSMLIIGSAAGVVVMGLEKITFGWYMKRITWIAFVGYLAGMASYWFEKTVIGL